MSQYCQFCGTPFEGEVCPACGAVQEEANTPQSKPTETAPAGAVQAEPSEVWPMPVLKRAQCFLWGLVLLALCICGITLYRTADCGKQFAENLDQYVQQRNKVTDLPETLDTVYNDRWLNNLSENIPRFLELGENNLIIPLKEVGE